MGRAIRGLFAIANIFRKAWLPLCRISIMCWLSQPLSMALLRLCGEKFECVQWGRCGFCLYGIFILFVSLINRGVSVVSVQGPPSHCRKILRHSNGDLVWGWYLHLRTFADLTNLFLFDKIVKWICWLVIWVLLNEPVPEFSEIQQEVARSIYGNVHCWSKNPKMIFTIINHQNITEQRKYVIKNRFPIYNA